jgi:hypothetical protein
MHLRVAGAGGVLGRRRRSDDGGIDDRPAPDDPSLTLEDLGLRREQLLRDLVGFEQVSEVEQRGRVLDSLVGEVERVASIVSRNCSRRETRRRLPSSTSLKEGCSLSTAP